MISGKRQLSREFFEWQAKYSLERTDEGRLRCLEGMLDYIPLGYTEFNNVRSYVTHLMRFIRERIAHRKEQAEAIGKSRRFFKSDLFTIALTGDANSGKTRLLNDLCGTDYSSTPVPFETKFSLVGIFNHNGVTIRVVEIPSSISLKHVRVLGESDLIIVLPNGSDRIIDFINSVDLTVPVKVLDEYPADLWSFLGLIVISVKGDLGVYFDGLSLGDLGFRNALVNGKTQLNNYFLKDGDVIS